MKTDIFNRPWRASGAALTAALLVLTTVNLSAGIKNGVVVKSVCGGGVAPFYGYLEGDPGTSVDAKFHTPIGLALDFTGQYLYVADRDNNAIRKVDLLSSSTHFNFTYTFAPLTGVIPTNLIASPVGVAVDTDDNVYILNRGNGKNGRVVVFDYYGNLLGTNSLPLTNANAITLDDSGNVFVTASNTLMQITFPSGFTTNIATVTNAGASLQGLVVMDSGLIAACDSGRHGIYLINPATGVISTNTGFNGAGDNNATWEAAPNPTITKANVKFNTPTGLAKAGNNLLIVADYGNNRIKVVNSTGGVTNLYGVNSNLWIGTYPGSRDGSVVVPDAQGDVEARLPNGVLFAPGSSGTVYVTEDYYHLIRVVTGATIPPVLRPPTVPGSLTAITNYGQVFLTWSAVSGTSVTYNLKRSPANGGPYTTLINTPATTYTDTNVVNGTTYYYVVSAVDGGLEGKNSLQVSATPPRPPVSDPQIGHVDFPATSLPVANTSVLSPVSFYPFFNDGLIVIKGTAGSGTYYTYGYTTNASLVPNPTSGSSSIPSDYQNGLFSNQVAPYTISLVAPAFTIKAMGAKGDGSPNSAVVYATFEFITGNPTINGNNAAQFTISDITANAHLYYTLDGTDPSATNGTDLGTVVSTTNFWTVGFPIVSNTLFKVRAFRDNYQPSAIMSNLFSPSDFVANTITFGFAAGEASSEFIGAPGQTFFAPVTLNPLSATVIDSLQFNLTVTNAGPNPGPAVVPGAYNFQSFLMKPIPGTTPVLYERIPPYMFAQYAANPPPPTQITNYDGLPFLNLLFTNSALNLLGVGWLERSGEKNLFDTVAQTLISFSQAHDTLFTPALGKVVLGGYSFQIPSSAHNGQTYQIQIGRPSATSDGIGAPSSSVYIDTPTKGSLTNGSVNSIKNVTVGQRKYIAGDAAPFRWFNAGDYGNTNLDNSDVMQVFEAAVYQTDYPLNYPPPGSDLFDAMDSCGATYMDLGHGYLEFNSTISGPGALNPLFNGNDSSINQIAFGDSKLDVCDVYVTFRRSLDPSLYWFRRFWTNGIRGAEILTNQQASAKSQNAVAGGVSSYSVSPTNPPSVSFAAADFTATPGQTLQVPITARVFGDFPLRVLMLNLSVDPLDGSPALTTSVQFKPNAALGSPDITSSIGNGNYAATWLDSTIAGLTGNASIGTLIVTIPANAPSTAAYAIHFDHVSASPNGLAAFPQKALTGLILLSDRSSSTYSDGIPDSWRLRYFGTVNNLLSQAAADADGDGASNWQEYVAGTDPTDSTSVLRVSTPLATAQQGQTRVVRWPSIAGKRYVIERSASLFPGGWTAVSTNTGTGTDMELDDTNGGKVSFYRVRILP